MSLLERRLQVLVDAQRYERLESEARATGRSVGALVRSAIDAHFDDAAATSAAGAAARRVLEATAEPGAAEPDWADSKASLLAGRDPGPVLDATSTGAE
ncbi:ribbon-helix-helix protein, CopG family [Georgenia sp. Z1491]|uniref:ribbon-helix-helix protein, CopG family n=1 Tax=Georgenia sp. Z1491 TaxID=3416707 RepID=UPI003CF1E859